MSRDKILIVVIFLVVAISLIVIGSLNSELRVMRDDATKSADRISTLEDKSRDVKPLVLPAFGKTRPSGLSAVDRPEDDIFMTSDLNGDNKVSELEIYSKWIIDAINKNPQATIDKIVEALNSAKWKDFFANMTEEDRQLFKELYSANTELFINAFVDSTNELPFDESVVEAELLDLATKANNEMKDLLGQEAYNDYLRLQAEDGVKGVVWGCTNKGLELTKTENEDLTEALISAQVDSQNGIPITYEEAAAEVLPVEKSTIFNQYMKEVNNNNNGFLFDFGLPK